MSVLDWALGFQTGLLMTMIFSIIIIIYFRLRQRLYKLEKSLKHYRSKDESVEESEEEGEPKEI